MKIAILTNCCKTKLDHPAPVMILNNGQIFNQIRNIAMRLDEFENNTCDFFILSGKYGILEGCIWIEPYNQKLNSKNNKNLIESINNCIGKIIENHDITVIALSKNYLSSIIPTISSTKRRICVISSKTGIFAMKSFWHRISGLTCHEFLELIWKNSEIVMEEYVNSEVNGKN